MKYDSKASKSSANTVVDFTSAKGIAHKNMAGFDFKNSVVLFFSCFMNVSPIIILNRCICVFNGVETFDMVIQRAERIC